ncbi:MAG: hypothetical protein R2912_13765, partial [Eubacteriales bacterium]
STCNQLDGGTGKKPGRIQSIIQPKRKFPQIRLFLAGFFATIGFVLMIKVKNMVFAQRVY